MTPAGFHSRTFNPAQKNYPTHDKEMLAIVDCLKKFEPQLTATKFEIVTDHIPLTHWETQKDLSPRQILWNKTLSHFDAAIHHIPGISNSAADRVGSPNRTKANRTEPYRTLGEPNRGQVRFLANTNRDEQSLPMFGSWMFGSVRLGSV